MFRFLSYDLKRLTATATTRQRNSGESLKPANRSTLMAGGGKFSSSRFVPQVACPYLLDAQGRKSALSSTLEIDKADDYARIGRMFFKAKLLYAIDTHTTRP